MTTADWTPARIEQLKSLWDDGLSCSQIARAMGGVSRNAVIGKVNRMGYNGADGARPARRMTRAPREKLAPTPRARVSDIPVDPAIVLDSGGHPEPTRLEDGSLATVMTVTDRMCRWPHGDPRTADFHFCGCAPIKGSPYCGVHSRRAWQPQKPASPNISLS